MKIDFVNLQRQYNAYKNQIDSKINEILSSSQFIMGPHVNELERKLSAYIGMKYGIGCASGTDAIMLALMAYDIGHGDEVITPNFTFISTAEVISVLGARPVFVYIDEKSYNIDADKIEEKINKQTRGIITVDLYGQCAEYEKINKIALENELFVIEDAAQSFGGKYRGKNACTLADIATTSFFPAKPFGCYGDGGMMFTNDDVLMERLKSMSMHGQTKRYYHKYIGINGRLDTLQAAILLAKFPYFKDEVQKRQMIAEKYTRSLSALEKIITPYVEEWNQSVFAQYTIRISDRDTLRSKLADKGIPTAIHYPMPLHRQEAFKYLNYKVDEFPVCNQVSKEVLSIPISAWLSEEEQDYIIKNVIECIENY